MSVLAFASEDPDAVIDFEAAWTLTRANIQRGIREPLRPQRTFRDVFSAAFGGEQLARARAHQLVRVIDPAPGCICWEAIRRWTRPLGSRRWERSRAPSEHNRE